jgi:hypothetical protein
MKRCFATDRCLENLGFLRFVTLLRIRGKGEWKASRGGPVGASPRVIARPEAGGVFVTRPHTNT